MSSLGAMTQSQKLLAHQINNGLKLPAKQRETRLTSALPLFTWTLVKSVPVDAFQSLLLCNKKDRVIENKQKCKG